MNTFWGIVFFLMPILGIVYIGWHIWLILPLQAWLKMVVLIFLGAAFALFFANFLLDIDSMPMAAATFIYNVGTSSIFIVPDQQCRWHFNRIGNHHPRVHLRQLALLRQTSADS